MEIFGYPPNPSWCEHNVLVLYYIPDVRHYFLDERLRKLVRYNKASPVWVQSSKTANQVIRRRNFGCPCTAPSYLDWKLVGWMVINVLLGGRHLRSPVGILLTGIHLIIYQTVSRYFVFNLDIYLTFLWQRANSCCFNLVFTTARTSLWHFRITHTLQFKRTCALLTASVESRTSSNAGLYPHLR